MIQQLLLFLLLFPFLSLPPLSKPRQSLPPPSQTPILRPQNVISPTRTTTRPSQGTAAFNQMCKHDLDFLCSPFMSLYPLYPFYIFCLFLVFEVDKSAVYAPTYPPSKRKSELRISFQRQ